MNDQRDQDRPFSADSSRNVPGRLAASLRYADSGVSPSASTLRVTGTTRCSAASARKSSRDVVKASVCTQMILPDWPNALGVAWTPMTVLRTGDTVAEFELPDQTGSVRSLRSLLANGPVVLFFYPAALTPGCTKEACHFRDLTGEFAALGVSLVGISTDPVAKQAK